MVSFTTLACAISMALFASAAPTVMEARGTPPPTSSVLDFTLFKSTDAGQENQCRDNVADAHVPPAEMGVCHKSPTFYTAKIYSQGWGYTCKLDVYNNDGCYGLPVGTIFPSNDYSSPCKFPAGSLIDLESWKVTCTY